MNETKYAYAVSLIRANEHTLLTESDMEQLIAADSVESALKVLSDKGYGALEDGTDYEAVLKDKQLQTWELLNSILPEEGTLDFLIVRNDYHNMKTLLKATISNSKTDNCFLLPSSIDTELMKTAVHTGDYSELPEYAQNDLKEAYELAARTNDGQFTDIMLDKFALQHMSELAKSTGDGFIIKTVETIIAVADIKIAIRGARTKKDSLFFDSALCACETLSTDELKKSAIKGEAEVFEYLDKTDYKNCVEKIKESNSAFEKWCDDELMASMDAAKTENFGVEPLVAYFYAKETEIRNIRIILSCIYNEFPKEKIIERMRELYV